MKMIRTVRGDIAPDKLGVTATHEHLWCNQSLCCPTEDFPSGLNAPMILRTRR